MKSKTKTPRGIRNNNPLNIRIGNSWMGEVKNPTDTVFEQFTEMRFGVRAGFMLLKRYIKRYQLNTIEKIIERWAPSNENYTESYIRLVCNRTGIDRNYVIEYSNVAVMTMIFQAMCYVENGREIDYDVILEGYSIAR